MALKSRITYRGFIPKASKRQINNVLRDGYHALGKVFFETNLPRRFTVAGAWSLGYARRSQRYENRKKALFGHRDPLVFSGQSRARALSEAMTKIVARAKKGEGTVELRLNVPTLNLRNPSGPNTRHEIETVSDRELGPLERVLERNVETGFTKLNETTKFQAG